LQAFVSTTAEEELLLGARSAAAFMDGLDFLKKKYLVCQVLFTKQIPYLGDVLL
jgi:hypothetical protein